jgi:hypothetical protein
MRVLGNLVGLQGYDIQSSNQRLFRCLAYPTLTENQFTMYISKVSRDQPEPWDLRCRQKTCRGRRPNSLLMVSERQAVYSCRKRQELQAYHHVGRRPNRNSMTEMSMSLGRVLLADIWARIHDVTYRC